MSEVKRTEELRRVLALPRRQPSDLEELAREMTALLKTPHGTQTLRPVQALALHDIGLHGGGFLPIEVGGGKTLIFALAAWVLGAKKPMGFLPAGLIENAERAMRALAQHWLVPTNLRLGSYDMLGREQWAKELEEYEPDALIFDEAHRLKNQSAACTRRVARFMAGHSKTPVVVMSGTIMRDTILDFAPCLFWALKGNAPLPMDPNELGNWAGALDEPKASRFGEEPDPVQPGALLDFCSPAELLESPVKAARLGFHRRLVETPGVVAMAGGSESVGASISITGSVYKLAPVTEAHYSKLRKAMLTPDDFELLTGVDVWRHAKELALGFHSIWSPRPPKEWLEPRKRWGAFVRSYLSRSRTLDSPEQVENAVLAGTLDDDDLLAAWLAVKDTYVPNVVEIWHDDLVLKLAAKWARSPGIVWTDHRFFAERLAKETGLPYYGAKGLDAAGAYIEDSDSKTIIASVDANRDGKNLQFRWSRNLFIGPPDGWDALQQAIARTHRPGQTKDTVSVDIVFGCREHFTAWRKIVAGTHAARDTVGGTPKLLLADLSGIPTDDEVGRFTGARW